MQDLFASYSESAPSIPGAGESSWSALERDFVEELVLDQPEHPLGGMGQLVRWARSRQKAFSPEARQFGVPMPRGVLLLGLPGVGKKKVARDFARLFGFRVLRLKLDTIVMGDPTYWIEALQQALIHVERQSPVVLLVDDLDKVITILMSTDRSNLPRAQQMALHLVEWLKRRTTPVFVVVTAFEVTKLHPDFHRAKTSLVDEAFFIDLPTQRERQELLKHLLEFKGRRSTAFDLGMLAKHTEGYTGGELEKGISFGLYEAYNEGRELTTMDIMRALQSMVPVARTLNKELAELRQRAPTFCVNAAELDQAQPGLASAGGAGPAGGPPHSPVRPLKPRG
jgi:SpoVK/Ycf46/Vps4 family AAA+-type ATPase